MKSILKRTGLVSVLGFALVFAYANLRTRSLTELNKKVHLKIFSIGQPADEAQAASIRQAAKLPGVTAVSVNGPHETVSVTFQPDAVSPAQIMDAISLGGQYEVAEKYFPPTPVCPVPPIQALKSQVLETLRIF